MEETTSTDDLRNPYIARQEILTEAFGHAFAQEWGLRAIGSPTGSGKNFTSSRAIAKLHVRNWRAWKNGELDGNSRPYIVISLSGRANRSDFAKMVADAVIAEADGEIDAEAAEGMVIDLASLSDGLISYLCGGSEGQEAVEPISAGANSCPFRSDDKAKNKELESCWSAAVEAAENLQRFGSVSSAMRQQLLGMLREAEYRLRCLARSLYYNAEKGVDGPRLIVGRDIVPEIWPAARLGEPGPKVIVATPNKLMMPIDTFSAGSISLVSADFAKRAVYLFDEIDKAKSDFLTAIISNRSADYQPDDLVRTLVARFLEGAEGTSPLLKGDPQAWRGLLFSARKERSEAAGEGGQGPDDPPPGRRGRGEGIGALQEDAGRPLRGPWRAPARPSVQDRRRFGRRRPGQPPPVLPRRRRATFRNQGGAPGLRFAR